MKLTEDNFEDVLKKLDVKLNLDFREVGGNILSLSFTEFEDFHPDRIFQQLPLFSHLRDIRQRLVRPQTFESAAREVRSWLTNTENEKNSESQFPDSVTTATEPTAPPSDLLDQILFQTR